MIIFGIVKNVCTGRLRGLDGEVKMFKSKTKYPRFHCYRCFRVSVGEYCPYCVLEHSRPCGYVEYEPLMFSLPSLKDWLGAKKKFSRGE